MKFMDLTDSDRALASKLAEEMGVLNNSIESGGGSLAGFLGEIAAQKIYGGEIQHTYQYDLVLPDKRTADVKTKRTSVAPRDYYECSVSNFNPNQKCDVYIFTRVSYDNKRCWVLGHYDKKKYIEEARFLKKGQTDGDNNFTVRADCYNMPILDLEKCPEEQPCHIL
jgi:hypothetical protein